MKEAIINLIGVKRIIALIITIALVAGFGVGRITGEQFLPLATMVIGFYFGRGSEIK
mgnify:FL=1